MRQKKVLKICYVLSYYFPEYVRTGVLINALSVMPSTRIYTAINKKTNYFRYLETIWRLLLVRLKHNPDLYILGFRGYEIYWIVRLLTWGKPLVFDHMMSPYDSLRNEKRQIAPGSFRDRFVYHYEKAVLENADLVLTDTPLHQRFFTDLFALKNPRLEAVHLGTDEKLFRPIEDVPETPFRVFFYGSFLPLHGVPVILEAAKMLQELPIIFEFIGGHKLDLTWFFDRVEKLRLTSIEHKAWVPYHLLPYRIAKVHLCLGGPFGNTGQGRRVITGKTFQFLAMAKPTVIGKVPYAYPFLDRINCLYVPQGDPLALARGIRWAFLNQARLREIGVNGYQTYLDHFSQKKITLQLNEIIRYGLLSP
ncbi:MAG: hypothetical protein QNJ22_15665 [Desulfosarcinaceae bacterium]|nr:hypothetical protein [Desulfosarcinaceae bacterium]